MTSVFNSFKEKEEIVTLKVCLPLASIISYCFMFVKVPERIVTSS